MIDSDITFGDWLRRQRRALDLTRAELAARAACSVSALRKFEADELRPSRPLAESLAGALQIAPEDRAAFVRLARDTRGANTTRSPVPTTGLQRPAPRSTVRSTLPAPPTALIGREQERAALGHLMRRADVRLLTLTGSGGTGKTRLALQLAADLHDAFRDGVCVVSLAPVTDPNLIAPTIAETLNIYEARGRSVLDTLHGYLRNKQMLLLLDNFEHVLAAAPIVAALLAEAPALKVLSTSRIPLHVRGEQEFAVLPLALPDPKRPPAIDQLARYSAVELFVQRARAVQYDFAVSEENAATVVEICRRLDGLPLAIELAAARSKIFPPRALLDQLGSRLAFLIGGPRDAPARQQTLRATIEWSYALLDAHEQALFGRLAVFGGAFSLQAAAAVCRAAGDLDADVVARVESLVDKSMVRADPTHDEPRFFMLETLREYALERLVASGEAETVRRRHAQFFLTLAEEDAPPFGFAMQAHWLERLEREHDNLRAALRWFMDRQVLDEGLRLGAALGPFWMGREYLTEGRMWLTELLQVAASEPVSAARAKALLGPLSPTIAVSLRWRSPMSRKPSRAGGRWAIQLVSHRDLRCWARSGCTRLTSRPLVHSLRRVSSGSGSSEIPGASALRFFSSGKSVSSRMIWPPHVRMNWKARRSGRRCAIHDISHTQRWSLVASRLLRVTMRRRAPCGRRAWRSRRRCRIRGSSVSLWVRSCRWRLPRGRRCARCAWQPCSMACTRG